MAVFESGDTVLNAPVETVYDTLSNLENLKELLKHIPEDQIPADKMEMFKGLEITSDSLTIPGGPTGPICLQVSKLERPSLIALSGVGLPVALTLELRLRESSPTTTRAVTAIDIAIPAMLKSMVAGPLQQVVDQFGMLLAAIPFGNKE